LPARILITPGEPAGVGPDLLLQLAQERWPVELVAVCDPALLRERAMTLGLPVAFDEIDLSQAAETHEAGSLAVLPVAMPEACEPGVLNPANADYVLETLRVACRSCVSGQAQAWVTGPVQKSVINQAGHSFQGHTEYIAELTSTETPVMMLVADRLRVALLTTHLPLKNVAKAVTRMRLKKTLAVLHHDLQTKFNCAQPCILVCGLNPHAGESGHLGREETDTIIPALEAARAQGMNVIGPLPADTLFTPKYLEQADAVLAMYHDQGLPVLKYAGFGESVNVTLGLPIIRTSVDHGTALDLAGTGEADAGSLIAAIELAISLSSAGTPES
tara:strand:+ start:236 stop:1228 length:993 start_codon:yes stop_codon:yes gene_type:complete